MAKMKLKTHSGAKKRFAPKKVTYKGIYSLELGKLIEVK